MGVIMRDEAEVLFANDAFYNAFISRDIVALNPLGLKRSSGLHPPRMASPLRLRSRYAQLDRYFIIAKFSQDRMQRC